MSSRGLPSWLDDLQQNLADQELKRVRLAGRRPAPGQLQIDDQVYWDYSSNDYLGLAVCPERARRAREILDQADPHAWGSAASPLVTGYHPLHQSLEKRWAQFVGCEASLLFPSGHAANQGVLSAILGPDDVVFCDKRNHASLIDGVRHSGAKLRVYRSDDRPTSARPSFFQEQGGPTPTLSDRQYRRLKQRLQQASSARCRWIVTDSVFSMEGDIAPLAQLADLAQQFDAYLYVDEAHAVGVLGPTGAGAIELAGVGDQVDLRLGTLSKALGSVGGIVSGSAHWINALLHQARPYIYSTALPPSCVAGSLASLEIIHRHQSVRTNLQQRANQLVTHALSLGYELFQTDTPILSLKLSSPAQALAFAQQLRQAGLWTVAIRPPTVPTGTSRVRLGLNAQHPSDADCHLFDTLQQLAPGQT